MKTFKMQDLTNMLKYIIQPLAEHLEPQPKQDCKGKTSFRPQLKRISEYQSTTSAQTDQKEVKKGRG